MLSTQVAQRFTGLQQQHQQQQQQQQFTILDEKNSSTSNSGSDLLALVDFGLTREADSMQHQQQIQQQQDMIWGPSIMKYDYWQCGGLSNDFMANNDAYYSQNQAAAAATAAAAAAAVANSNNAVPMSIDAATSSAQNSVKKPASASRTPSHPSIIEQDSVTLELESTDGCPSSPEQHEEISTHSEPGPYNLQLRLEDFESDTAPSFHQRLNASGGSSLSYAIGFHPAEKDIMQKALTAPEEKITKSIVLRNREVLASLWCKELAPVRLFLHGNFEAALADSQAARLVIRCGTFKQHQLPVKECTVCSDQKHRGGWYGADKRDTNSSKTIPDALQHYWPADARSPTLHKNSLVIVRNDACEYLTDSRDRVYAVLPLTARQSTGPMELQLYYTCMTTHSHDATAPNSKDTFTSVQLETFDSLTGRWISQGRSVFRMRMVTSPERDILNEVTQFLTPAQMGCRMGCGHLESHNTRWQKAKVLRNQGQEKFDYYVQLYGSEPGLKNGKAKNAKSRQATGSNADPTDDFELLDGGAAVSAAGQALPLTPVGDSSGCLLEVAEHPAADGSLIIRGSLLSNSDSRELIASALRAYLDSLRLIVKGVAAAAKTASSASSKVIPPAKQEAVQPQPQQHLPSPSQVQQHSPAESMHSGTHHCSSAVSSVGDHSSSTYHMQDTAMSTAACMAVPPPIVTTAASSLSTSVSVPTTSSIGSTDLLPLMMHQDTFQQQQQQQQQMAQASGVQYFSLQQPGIVEPTIASSAPVYLINTQMAAAALAAATSSSGSIGPTTILPHIASHQHQQQQQQFFQQHPQYLQQHQQPVFQIDPNQQALFMQQSTQQQQQQHSLHSHAQLQLQLQHQQHHLQQQQQIILSSGFGHDQVDGLADGPNEDDEDNSEECDEAEEQEEEQGEPQLHELQPLQVPQAYQQQQQQTFYRKSATSLLRRLAAVKRRRLRGGASSLGQLFKAKQK